MKHHVHETHPDIVNRLKRAEGHLRKVIAMLESGENCATIAQQLHGVHNAIGNAKTLLITDHIEHCLDESLIDSDVRTQKSTLKEFKEITKYL
jgi:uncharacterized protein